VPFLIRRPVQPPDSVEAFTEQSCARGSFGILAKDAFIRAVLAR